MNEQIKQDIISVLTRAIDAIKRRDTSFLSELSNHVIHNASIFQDEDSISVAVIIYALSKIIAREGGKAESKLIFLMTDAIHHLEQNQDLAYKKCIKKIVDFISYKDNKIRLYIQEVFVQARIKKGSKIYDHGISLARTAEILGISQWELMDYIGKTEITNRFKDEMGVEERLKIARNFFQERKK